MQQADHGELVGGLLLPGTPGRLLGVSGDPAGVPARLGLLWGESWAGPWRLQDPDITCNSTVLEHCRKAPSYPDSY